MLGFKHRISFLSLILIAFIYVFAYINYSNPNPIMYDALGYYIYLPQGIIHQNFHFTDLDFVEKMVSKYNIQTQTLYQFFKTDQGFIMTRYPIGLALLFSPFYLIAHFYTLFMGAEADGFSQAYQSSVVVAHIFYVLLGFFYLRKVLKIWYKDSIVTIVLLITAFFTTMLIQALAGAGMTHGPLFGLQMMIIYYSCKWHQNPNKKLFFLLGFLISLAAVTRPTEILISIIPLLWNVDSLKSFINKLKFLKSLKKMWFFFFGGFLIPVSFQMVYWYFLTGKPVFYSYNDPGEGFEFIFSPVLESFFSPRSGLFLYSPVLLFALVGFYFMKKENKNIFLAFSLFILIYYYTIGSWTAVSYGFRAYTQSFGVMAVGVAHLFSYFSLKDLAKKLLLYLLVIIILSITALQFVQIFTGVIDPNSTSWKYYFSVFGKLHAPPGVEKFKLVDRFQLENSSNPIEGYHLSGKSFQDDFAKSETKIRVNSIKNHNKFSLRVPDDNPYAGLIEKTYKEVTEKDHAVLKASLWFYPMEPMDTLKISAVMHFTHGGLAYHYRCQQLEHILDNVQINKWNYYEFYYITPEVRRKSDMLKFYAWKRGKGKVLIDDLNVVVYEKDE